MIVYAGSARSQFVHGAVLIVTSLCPLGVVFAAIVDRIRRGDHWSPVRAAISRPYKHHR